jgi:hypothetical protein
MFIHTCNLQEYCIYSDVSSYCPFRFLMYHGSQKSKKSPYGVMHLRNNSMLKQQFVENATSHLIL